ncbi:MAG: helix-turn-helix domain-containing protein [Myxococcota bacterium]
MKPKQSLKRNEKKWGAAVMKCGWTAIPNILLEKQHALSLRPVDLCVLLQLMKCWWDAERPPFPSKERIGKAIDCSPRTVQRSTAYIESLGLLDRRKRPGPMGTNDYHFDKLVEKLKPYALEALVERDSVAKQKEERMARKKARLQLVGTDD